MGQWTPIASTLDHEAIIEDYKNKLATVDIAQKYNVKRWIICRILKKHKK